MSARPTTWLCAGTALTLVGLAAGCTTETTATASGGGATVTVDRAASHSLSRNTPWHGRRLTGAVHATILRGAVTAREGEPAPC